MNIFKKSFIYLFFGFLILLFQIETSFASENHKDTSTVIVLFDGLFARFRSDSSNSNGIEKINKSLQRNFNSNQNSDFSSRAFHHYEIEEAYKYIKSFNDLEQLVIIGYSLGGRSAIKLANDLLLPENQTIELLIQIDSVKANNNTLPDNVNSGINYYQESTDFLEPQGIRLMSGSENINVETLFSDTSITHLNIDDNQYLANIILEKIDDLMKIQSKSKVKEITHEKKDKNSIIELIEENLDRLK